MLTCVNFFHFGYFCTWLRTFSEYIMKLSLEAQLLEFYNLRTVKKHLTLDVVWQEILNVWREHQCYQKSCLT